MHVSGHEVNRVAVLYYCGQVGFQSWQTAIVGYGIVILAMTRIEGGQYGLTSFRIEHMLKI